MKREQNNKSEPDTEPFKLSNNGLAIKNQINLPLTVN